MYVCVCYHLVSETTRFYYPDKPLMDEMGYERSELQRFCCKKVFVVKILKFFSPAISFSLCELLQLAQSKCCLSYLFMQSCPDSTC